MVSEFDAPLESNDLVGVTLDRSDRSSRRSIRPRASELKWGSRRGSSVGRAMV